MFELIPESMRTVVIIGGLSLLFIFAASLVYKHEQHIAERKIAEQRMARDITYVLDQVSAGMLPAGLGVQLRKEVLARYMTIMNKQRISQRCEDLYKRTKSMLEILKWHESPDLLELDG